jgi:hypothetical protein
MAQQLVIGQEVTVNSFGGKKLTRIVVDVRGDTVLVCKPEEFRKASEEHRPPVSVGFQREDIIEAKR